MRLAVLHLCSPHLTRFSSFRLVTLAMQNAALSIAVHHSHIPLPPSQTYSSASAVLLTEILKGLISLTVSVIRVFNPKESPHRESISPPILYVPQEIFSADSWKFSIPAIVYVIQNSL